MNLKNKNIIFALTGSFHTLKNTILQMNELVKEGANILPIMSYTTYNTDTKYGKAKDFIDQIEKITQKAVIHTIQEIKLILKKETIDITIIAPCTGNTLAKLTNGISDTPVLMAVKLYLKNEKPLVIGISTNDGLSRKC